MATKKYEMDASLPHVCVRGNEGFFIYQTSTGKPFRPYQMDSEIQQKSPNQVYGWSRDGRYLAWCNSERLVVFDVQADFAVVFQVAKSRVISIEFSPRNTYISTFEPFSNANNSKDNICVYSFLGQNIVATFTQGTFASWAPQFSDDERVCCRFFKDTALFFEDGDFSKAKHKISIPGMGQVQMFPGAPNHVAVYVSGSKKGTPSVVKILRYPDLDQYKAMASKSFFKGDKASLHWNTSGSALIVKSMTEVDQSGKAYYGETMLFYVSTEGSSAVVELKKAGPIYDVCWDPTKNEFCVVYGHMPSKASLFNSKCLPVYDFGTGLRTACQFSPQGHLLALYGHGNVQSNVEIWHRPTFSLVAKIVDFQDLTCFEWSPCGERFLLGTLSPTLKVDNKWAVYDYLGKRIDADNGKEGMAVGSRGGSNFEFWQVSWQKRSTEEYPAKALEFTAISLQDLKVQEATEKKYVPPHLRKKMESEKRNVVVDLNDLPDNERAAAMNGQNSAKGTTKKTTSASGHHITYRSGGGTNSENQAQQVVIGMEPASEKTKKNRVKTLEKRLKEIRTLKEKQKSGQKMEEEAIKKINREDEVRAELNSLKAC